MRYNLSKETSGVKQPGRMYQKKVKVFVMTSRYAGNSKAYTILEEEYVAGYAVETLLRRAIPDERDGLKMVQRRTLYKAKTEKIRPNDKSQKLLGAVTMIHPHGDASIYDTMTRLCDRRGQLNIPLLSGKGNFGTVYSSDPAAAARYTECWMHPNAEDFFTCQKGLEWVPAEVESEGSEPGALNVSYPSVLTMASGGIAVSANSKIPSFNFWDVLELTEKFIRKGGILEPGDEIIPDFPTGANIIFNQKELFKILKTGIGSFKLRSEITVRGKDIEVEEVPYGMTIEQMRRRIKALEDIPEIKECEISQGATTNAKLTITCSNGKVVDSVVAKLMAKGILQTTFSSRMVTVFKDTIHVAGGIEGILKRWVPWRRGVIQKHYAQHKTDLQVKMEELSFFIRLVENPEWRDKYVALVTKQNRRVGAEYLREIMTDITDKAQSWISERPLSSFNNGGKYRDQYDACLAEIAQCEVYIQDPDIRILEDFKELKVKYAGQFERKTRVSMTDFSFKKGSETAEDVDTSYAMFFIYEDGFVFKTRGEAPNKTGSRLVASLVGQANMPLLVLNTAGNIVRMYGEDLPFSGARDTTGTHIQGYSGCDEGKVVAAMELEPKKKMIYYSDGWVGFLDMNEFIGQKRKTRLVRNGVSREIGNVPVAILDAPNGEYSIIGVSQGVDGKGRDVTLLGVKESEEIIEKSRTSRTRLFTCKKGYLATELLVLEGNAREDFWVQEEDTVFPAQPSMFTESMKPVHMFWDGFETYGEDFQTVE